MDPARVMETKDGQKMTMVGDEVGSVLSVLAVAVTIAATSNR